MFAGESVAAYDRPMGRPCTPILPLALLALSALGIEGCTSKATAYGGRFTFAYASMVEHENFVKPIAPGAKLEIHALGNASQEELTVKAARSSRPGVVAVHAVRGQSVILEGREPGVAEIEITARDQAGTDLVDTMFFHVAKPATHRLEHACTEEPNAVYVRGEDVVIHHSLATGDRRPVIGFDYAPVKVEPSGALDLVQQPQAGGYYLFRASSAKPRITLRSTVDDKVLTMRVVDRAELTDASLLYDGRLIVGRSSYVVADVRAGDATLCNQTALTKARSLTPAICKVTARLDEDPDGEESNREQLAKIEALAFGVCSFEVTLPELAKGRGVVLKGEVKIGREEYPGERGTGAWIREGLASIPAAKDAAGLAVLAAYLVHRRRRRSSPTL